MGHIGEHVTLDDPAYIHESAWLYGKVYVGPGASIWPNVVTRAETFEIRIGARTNIQDFNYGKTGINRTRRNYRGSTAKCNFPSEVRKRSYDFGPHLG